MFDHESLQRAVLLRCLDRMGLRYEVAPTAAMARVDLHGEGGRTAAMRVRVASGVMSWDRLVELNGPQPDLPVVLSYARTGHSPQLRPALNVDSRSWSWMACASIPVYPGFDERLQTAALMAVAATPMYRTFDALVGRGEELEAHSSAAQSELEAKLETSARALGFAQHGERMMWHALIADRHLRSTHEAWLWLDSERWLVMEVVPERGKYSPSDDDLLACQAGIVLGGLGRDVRGLPGWCYRAPAIWFAELLDEPRFVQVMLDQGVHACQLVATRTR